ncbi:protein distal antenna [Nasonia vitripennis]|uniref:HTH psq-type domain-containing protein n=1 Tax=Nasonia vitripennis TaxID=7425 RepID=A0A7M7QCM8_NASVI|nr:protein distal antenna [Nasonia vitripennis]
MRGESARPGKRPLRALSAAEKMDAIQRVHEGESKASVARDIGVPESTLRGWCKSEHKIRGMARNSSTPDSAEALSPASSNGANALISNLSSEDEGMAAAGGPASKKFKLDLGAAGCSLNDNSESNEAKQPKQLDYLSSLINSLIAGGMRPENSSLLMQQLGLLTGAQSAPSLTQNLLNLSAAGLGSAAHLGPASTQAVGLVENGLQYSKSSVGSGNKRHSSSSTHISAIAPTSQFDSVSKSRKSLPPAAEAPLTPVPASPRKTNDQHSGSAMGMNLTSRPGSKSKDNGYARNKPDEAFWLWLTQQQQLIGHQAAALNASAEGSWFWQWYKQSSLNSMVSPTPLAQAQQQQQQQQPQQQQTTQQTTLASRKSPSKAKAVLDNVLNNNDDKVRRSLNLSGEDDAGQNDEVVPPIPTEKAIEHADIFFKWLDQCSEPSVTRMQILQFKYLLDNLKTCRNRPTGVKQSRK